MVRPLASFLPASRIAVISQELVPQGPPRSLTAPPLPPERLMMGSHPFLSKEKQGGDSSSQVRAAESKQDETEKSTREINRGT